MSVSVAAAQKPAVRQSTPYRTFRRFTLSWRTGEAAEIDEVKGEQIRFNPKISAAIRERDLVALQDILAAEPQQLETFTPFAGGTWLHYASRDGDIDAVRLLISLGVDVNIGDSRDGRTPVCDACLGGNEEIVRVLLDAGAKLDTSDPIKNPLFSSIVGRSLPSAKILLDSGIDTEARYSGASMKDMDAVAFALEQGEVSIAEEIARRQAMGNPKSMAQIIEAAQEVAAFNNT